jgi:hypothetical protein
MSDRYTPEEIESAFGDVLTKPFLQRALARLERIRTQREAKAEQPSAPTELERHRIRVLARRSGLHVRRD